MSFAADKVTRDAFLDRRLHLLQPKRGYRAAIDPVLLAAYVPAQPGQRALDFGCGVGTAALCLALRVPGLDLHGLEVQPDYAELAGRNARLNGVALKVHVGDLRDLPTGLRAQIFDHVLMNPPFQRAEEGIGPQDPGRDLAQREDATCVRVWIAEAMRRLAPGGWLTLVHRVARLGEIFAALDGRAGDIELLPVAPHADRPAGRILVRTRKGRAGPVSILPPLVLHMRGGDSDPDSAAYTARAQVVLRGLQKLP